MSTRSGSSSLGVAGILNASFLAGIAPGEPFFGGTELGFADRSPDATAKLPADRAAQAAGYTSYADYWNDRVPITFLGVPMRGRGSGMGHPYLAGRLKAVESFLRQRHPGPDGDRGVIKAIGWNGIGNSGYDDEINTKLSHQHTMGLAIDIDPAHNPYMFTESAAGLTHEQAMWWISTFEDMFRIAMKIYGGEAIAPDILLTWSKTSSTEALFQRVQSTSDSFAKFLELSKKPKEDIMQALVGAGYSPDDASSEFPNVQKAEGLFHKGYGRQQAKTITNIREELLIALRHRSWGRASRRSI